MRKEFIRTTFASHMSLSVAAMLSVRFRLLAKTVGIATAEPENIRADELFSRALELFSFSGTRSEITFNLNL